MFVRIDADVDKTAKLSKEIINVLKELKSNKNI